MRYRSATGLIPLSIRTVLAEPVPAPAIRTVHDLATTLLAMRTTAFGRRGATPGRGRTPTRDDFRALNRSVKYDDANTDRRPWAVSVDGVEFHGHRKDFADGSVAEVPWNQGIRVLCFGDTDVLDRLKLNSTAGIPWGGEGTR